MSSSPQWDVIVIGSGMGGSAAGAICALHGLKTLILDKNPRPGGSCSYYEKKGFRMDVGTHLFIRGNKGPFGVCTRRLGMGEPIDFKRTFRTTRVRGLNASLSIPMGKIGMVAAAPILASQLKIPFYQLPPVIRLFRDIITMPEDEVRSLDRVSIDEFIRRYTDHSELRAMLGFLLGLFFILPTWEASAGESVWNLQRFFRDANLCYPKGGASAIPETFLRGAEMHGAQVRLNCRVEKIEADNGRVKGVVLNRGERISCRAVISTTSLHDTVFRLAGPENFPASYVDATKSVKGSMIAVQVKIAVRKKVVRAGSLVGGAPLKYDSRLSSDVMEKSYSFVEQGIMPKFIPVYAPVPTNYDPDLAPPGRQIITACAVAPTTDIKLKDPPKVWLKGLMDALYAMAPGLKQNIMFYDSWTVQNIADWIGKSSGSAVTTGQTVSQVGDERPGHLTPIKGLFMAGDCAGSARGVGTELACQSGMDCGDLAAEILRRP